MQVSLQKVLLGLTDVDASKRRLWEGVGWNKSEAIQAHLMDTVNGLYRKSPTKVKADPKSKTTIWYHTK